MANGAQEGAAGKEIGDTSFLAELVHRVKNVDLQLAQFLYGVYLGHGGRR